MDQSYDARTPSRPTNDRNRLYRSNSDFRNRLQIGRGSERRRDCFGSRRQTRDIANLQSIRSLNRNGTIDSDHWLDATEFLRRSFGPWPRTQTTRPFFKFSCSNGWTAPGTGQLLRAVDRTDALRGSALVRRWGRVGTLGVADRPASVPAGRGGSSSRNGSIARGNADTSSAPERRRRALGCQNFREGGAPRKRAKLLSLYQALVLTSTRRTRFSRSDDVFGVKANRHRPPARSYDSDNRQGLAPCNEWRLS